MSSLADRNDDKMAINKLTIRKEQIPPEMKSLYVLQLKNGKYYIGKSLNVPSRYKQHKDGIGCMWTTKYPPICVIEVRRLKDEYDENNTTKQYMKKYGIDNVRGGAYCQMELPSETKKHIEHEMNSQSDTCYKCGEYGHFAKNCDYDDLWECDYCPRAFHTEKQCLLHEKKCVGQLAESGCYRCGRQTHWISNCYATTDVDGNYIDD